MKKIYPLPAPWIDEQTSSAQPAQTAYLRPTIFSEEISKNPKKNLENSGRRRKMMKSRGAGTVQMVET